MAESDNIWTQPIQPISRIMNDKSCLKDIPTLSGIYKIINLNTGDFYIGSTKNFRERARQHYNVLIRNCHHNKYLQNSWNKNGKDKFLFEVIDILKSGEDILKIFEREQQYIVKETPKFNLTNSVLVNFGGFRRKRTEARGEKHYAYGKPELGNNTKLNWEKVRQIRELFVNGEKIKDIAKKFSISRPQTDIIIRNISWQDTSYGPVGKMTSQKESKERITKIREDWVNGGVREEICKKYDISKTTFSLIINNRVWYDETYINPIREKSKPKILLGLNKSVADKIREDFIPLERNYPYLCEKYGMSLFRIKNIVSNTTFADKKYDKKIILRQSLIEKPKIENIKIDIESGMFREDILKKYKIKGIEKKSTSRIQRVIIKAELTYQITCKSRYDVEQDLFDKIYLKYRSGSSVNGLSKEYNISRKTLIRLFKKEDTKNG